MTSLKGGVKMGLMKKLSLYIFLVLMWCNVGFANNFYCNVDAYGFDGNKWRSYPDNVFLITYDNQNLIMTDTMINMDWNFEIIKNDKDHISAVITSEKKSGLRPVLESIIFYKKKLFVVFAYSADDGITINKGQCFRK